MKISVDYTIEGNELKRLKRITEEANKQGYNFTPESMFESIMSCGCKWDILDKLSFTEWQVGLISYDDYYKNKNSWKSAHSKQ